MRRTRWLILALLLIAPALLAACGGEPLPALITPLEAQSRLASGDHVVLLDVRTQQEWAEDGRSPDATFIPLEELGARLDELNRDDTIIVVCRSGNRSQQAASFLRDHGFAHITEIEGGMRRWASAGLPLECDLTVCGLAP